MVPYLEPSRISVGPFSAKDLNLFGRLFSARVSGTYSQDAFPRCRPYFVFLQYEY